jgi:kynurenine--oxoglutarate transaminase/cysteine-S-conjugate beta-lyase/glutamine--phenylpyruvate transaminase
MFYFIYYSHLVILLMDNKMIQATLPGMWERTITIGSAGKTFSVTGWKLGWAYGPANLMVNLQMVHQNCVYTETPPSRSVSSCRLRILRLFFQEATAIGFEKEMARLDRDECYFNSISTELVAKRDYMAKFLQDVGMEPTVPEGGYFMVADWSPLGNLPSFSVARFLFLIHRFEFRISSGS